MQPLTVLEKIRHRNIEINLYKTKTTALSKTANILATINNSWKVCKKRKRKNKYLQVCHISNGANASFYIHHT